MPDNKINYAYRGTYWNKPQGMEESSHSPAKREALRTQKLTKQYNAPEVYNYRAKSKPDALNKSTLDGFKTGSMNSRFHETGGGVRSLPTQVPDLASTVNVNHLRATRDEAIWRDVYTGVRTYNAKNLTGNANEEQFDLAYLHGNGTQMFKRMYETTSMAANKQATAVHQQKVDRANMYAKQPDPNSDYRSIHRRSVNYINYADPVVGTRDHTLSTPKKGCFWVGSGDVDRFQTTNMTAYDLKKKHEFQTRCTSVDTKSRMLNSILPNHQPPPDVLDAYTKKWNQNEATKQHEKNMITEYKGEFLERKTTRF